MRWEGSVGVAIAAVVGLAGACTTSPPRLDDDALGALFREEVVASPPDTGVTGTDVATAGRTEDAVEAPTVVFFDHALEDVQGSLRSVVRTPGGYAACGNATQRDTRGFLLAHFLADGRLDWFRIHDRYADSEHARAIAAVEGGGFTLVGTSTQPNTGTYSTIWDGWVVRTDAEGHHLWSEAFGDAWTQEALWDVIAIEEGASIAVGWVTSASGDTDPYLVTLDANGNTSDERIVPLPDNQVVRSVVRLDDDSLIVAGSSGPGVMFRPAANWNNLEADVRTWAARIAPNGTVVWQESFGPGQAFGEDVARDGTGTFALVGARFDPADSGLMDGLVVFLDEHGVSSGVHEVGGEKRQQLHQAIGLDEGFVLVGFNQELASSGWLRRVNQHGTPLWDRRPPTVGHGNLSAGIRTDDGFVFVGQSQRAAGPWILGTDGEGRWEP